MADIPETKYCSNCKRDIASSNYMMHEVHCRRHVVLCEHCQEPVSRSELDSHFEEYHAPKACSMCKEEFEVSKIEKHEEEECPKRSGKCEFCEIQMPRDDLVGHETYCGTRTELCTLCQQYIMIKDLEQHTLSGCTYPPRKQNVPKNNNQRDPDVLLPDEFYNNFAMDEMSRILNSELSPNPGIPVYGSRELADSAIERSRPSQAATQGDAASRRKKPAPRQPMQRRQNVASQPSRSTNPNRNLRKKSNAQQRELAHLQTKPNNQQRALNVPRSNLENGDLDELLARHLAQDLAGDQVEHSHNLLSNDTLDDEFVLPCEFCGEPFSSEDLIQHQGMCAVGVSDNFNIPSSHSADDVLGAVHSTDQDLILPSRRTFDDNLFMEARQPSLLNNRVQRRRQPSPPEPEILDNFSEEIVPGIDDDLAIGEYTMLPCEFCDNLFPGDSLLQHQVVCEPNATDDRSSPDVQPQTRGTNSRPGPRNPFATGPRPDTHRTNNSRQQENPSGVSIQGNGGALGSTIPTSLIRKDKDNKARQNLLTKNGGSQSSSSDTLFGGTSSESRARRRQQMQNGGASSYQPSFGNSTRAAPKLVNKARKQSQTDDHNLMVTGSRTSKTNEGSSANGTSRTGARQTTHTRTTTSKLTNSTRPRRSPQGDA